MLLDRTGAILQQQGQGVANLIIQFRRLVVRGRQLDERRVVELLASLVQRLQRPGIRVVPKRPGEVAQLVNERQPHHRVNARRDQANAEPELPIHGLVVFQLVILPLGLQPFAQHDAGHCADDRKDRHQGDEAGHDRRGAVPKRVFIDRPPLVAHPLERHRAE